jgi:paraquat-inducible protein B
MNKKISPAVIGAFVLGAMALIVIAILVFGSGRLFRQTRNFVLYFDTSVNGLRVGAPVKLKGVEIGSVKDIRILVGHGTGADKIPVIIEIDLKKLTSRGAADAAETTADPEAMQKVIIDRGLRGQLDMESLVTGLLYVALDFFPGTPIDLVQKPGRDYDYPEIPTVPTTLEQAKGALTRVISKLEEIDFKELGANLESTLKGVNRTVNSPEIESVLRSLARLMPKVDEAVVNIRNLAGTTEAKVKILADDLQQTSGDARLALKQAGDALKQTQETMKRAEAAVANIETLTDLDSTVNYELVKGLKDVSSAARSLRSLTDYLERNPRAPIFGKPNSKEN